LPPELDELTHKAIGCCIAVHRELGPGLPEAAYSRALALEFEAVALAYERECRFKVSYRGCVVCTCRLDLLVDRRLVLEIKSVERTERVHTAQAIGYPRLTGCRIALVVISMWRFLKRE
jgi:GxxExxY protein